ncbi:hypothetical protein C1T17_15290 [Sphingobium sp. SCG-1]|nr:hypothetical protein C1T17_15290 [Sphingobium sp. SCG-1]
MAAFAGSAAALAMLSVPIPLIELVVASSGLSEVVPAAAPPLGSSARAIMAGFAGLMGMGLSLTLIPRSAAITDKPAQDLEEGQGIMGFALGKLTTFTRGRGRTKPLADVGGKLSEAVPVLRRADAHPDAPPRRPIFASEDFGGAQIFAAAASAPVAEREDALSITSMADALDFVDEDAAVEITAEQEAEPVTFGAFGDLSMPRSPEPLGDRTILTEAIEALPAVYEPVAEAEANAIPVARAPLDTLNIAELVDRFEHGIARRKALAQAAAAVQQVGAVLAETGMAATTPTTEPRVLADMPPVPRVDVRAGVDEEIDEALRAALGTLQQITSR